MSGPGIAPTITGDHVVALYAQLNRFRANAGSPPLPLTQTITPEAAYSAVLLLQARLVGGIIQLPDPEIAQQQAALYAAMKNPIPYVSSHLDQIVQTIAIYGDTLKLPTATVGVTENSVGGMPLGVKIGLGLGGLLLLGWGAYAAYKHSQRGGSFELPGSPDDAIQHA